VNISRIDKLIRLGVGVIDILCFASFVANGNTMHEEMSRLFGSDGRRGTIGLQSRFFFRFVF
jgi:hypothetical protein